MRILKFPDPELLRPCVPVNVFGPELLSLLDNMWDTMYAAYGMGLAANQVGLPWRMFVMEGPKDERIYLVNPVIINQSKATVNLKEGCLSAPGEFIAIPTRASWVHVSYQNEKGEAKSAVFSGIWAVCVQHEIGHLDGESFLTNRSIPKKVRQELKNKWRL